MLGKRALVVAGVVGLLAIGGANGASAAAARSAPHWRIVKLVKGQAAGEFSTVVATGRETGWAFESLDFGGAFAALERNGAAWTRHSFPIRADEFVAAAGASSPSNVWAVTTADGPHGGSRVLRFNGHTWSAVRTFSRPAGTVTVRAASDVWLFGPAGVWHYNGDAWSKVGGAVSGGTVVNDHDVWTFSDANVYRWNGHRWTVTSLKALLPPKDEFHNPGIDGILALSASSVYVTGDGHAQDAGGPVVLLHYDGREWRQVAKVDQGRADDDMSPDGHGGLWIPLRGVSGELPEMTHYTGGKLIVTALPDNTGVADISRVPGTTEQLAGGVVPNPKGIGFGQAAVILQYS